MLFLRNTNGIWDQQAGIQVSPQNNEGVDIFIACHNHKWTRFVCINKRKCVLCGALSEIMLCLSINIIDRTRVQVIVVHQLYVNNDYFSE
jgi:hypothetical protein